MAKESITQFDVKRLFNYCPESGTLTRKIATGPTAQKGRIVGTDNGSGYLCVKIDYKSYKVHRLIWLFIYGRFPEKHIDHANRCRHDNRIDNLTEVDDLGNSRNRSMNSNNTSGVTGVRWIKEKHKWRAVISVNKKVISLGMFNCITAAAIARKTAEIKYGFSDTHGIKTRLSL